MTASALPTVASERRKTKRGSRISSIWIRLVRVWVLVKADELSAQFPDRRRLPLVVNCSFGSMAGPKDGQSDLERRITQFVETYRAGGPERLCTVVLSAGNFLLARTAAQVPAYG